jgi:RNA polymerase sigma-70 factor (ECF subfamily)
MPSTDQNNDCSWELKETFLLRQVSEGDWDAYAQLFNYYLPRLTRYIFPFANRSMHDTEEVIQEVFLRIWERRQTLSGIRSFSPYLFRMAKNKLINTLQQRQSHNALDTRYGRTREQTHSEPENILQYNEYRATALKGIDRLSPKLRIVFVLSTQEEWSLDEISTGLRLPKETVRKRLYMATNFIRTYLRKHAEWSLF